jgi:hypothetical protein
MSQATAQGNQPTAPAAAPDASSLICIRKPAMTGSLLTPRPECHTAAEWKARQGAASTTGINDTQQFKTLQRPTIVGSPSLGSPG